MGKNADFSAEEMEFLVGCFMKNLGNSEIREKIQDTEFPRRPARTIGKIRKTYEAVKRAYEQKTFQAIKETLESALDKMAEDVIKSKAPLGGRQVIEVVEHMMKGDFPTVNEKTGEILLWMPHDF